MEIFQHDSLEQYRKAQIKRNKCKIDKVWAEEGFLNNIAKWLLQHLGEVNTGMCHGVRTGFEVQVFRGVLQSEVWGTDISPTVSDKPYCFEWDFHQIKDEWVDSFDFIYSNSLDHSYDPHMCLRSWFRCIRPNGICIIEWQHKKKVDSADCFTASYDEMEQLLSSLGEVVERVKRSPDEKSHRRGKSEAFFTKKIVSEKLTLKR